MHPVSVITPYNHAQNTVTQSQQNMTNISTTLVHNPNITSPRLLAPNKVKRNQSFHGFQGTNNIRFHNPGLSIPRQTFGQGFFNAPSFPNLNFGISNQIYQNNPFGNSTSSIGPLILSGGSSRMSLNRVKSNESLSLRAPGQTNLAFSPPRNQYFQPLRFGPSSTTLNPFSPSRGATRIPPRLPLFSISTQNIQGNFSQNLQKSPKSSKPTGVPTEEKNTPRPTGFVYKNPLSKSAQSIPDFATFEALKEGKFPEKGVKKYGSLEHKHHKCNSPQFYSVRCKKHGKKRTIFELYTLPPKNANSTQNQNQEPQNSTPKSPPSCVIVSQIPKEPSSFKDDEVIYQNLTDSIQILEQNHDNDMFQFLSKPKPKPAPRCKKHQNIYQNIFFTIQKKEKSDDVSGDETSRSEENTSNLHKENESSFGDTFEASGDLENSLGSIGKNTSCEIDSSPFSEPNGTKTSPGFLELSCVSSVNSSGNCLDTSCISEASILDDKSPKLESKKLKLSSPNSKKDASHLETPFVPLDKEQSSTFGHEKGSPLRSTFSKKCPSSLDKTPSFSLVHNQSNLVNSGTSSGVPKPLRSSFSLRKTKTDSKEPALKVMSKNEIARANFFKNSPQKPTGNDMETSKTLLQSSFSQVGLPKRSPSFTASQDGSTHSSFSSSSTKTAPKPNFSGSLASNDEAKVQGDPNDPKLKCPIPIKPNPDSLISNVPKMALMNLDNRTKTSNIKNPFYTLTPDLRQFTPQSYDQQFSTTLPNQRGSSMLLPRALFQEQNSATNSISKSKSFSSKSKNKKTFQIPLQKCHSFRFQTAESYFQPIKNLHEENLMKNGFQGDHLSGNYSNRDCQNRHREKHKPPSRHGPLIFKRPNDKFQDMQFHENVQNSVKLQYPQPLYAQKSSGNGIVKKNGVVYADLELEEKNKTINSSEKESLQKKLQKARTEYATLKFNEVGNEIDV